MSNTPTPPTFPQGAARRISTKRKLFFTAVIMVFMLVLGEIGLRVRAWLRYGVAGPAVADTLLVHDPKLDLHVPRPGYEQQGRRISIKINSLGFRGEEITLAKPPGTIRIACLGASTTFCAEVTQNQAAWPAQLQERLQRMYPDVKVQVVNTGIPGYTAAENLKNLQRRVLPLQPDLVIFYDAPNDMAQDVLELARARGLVGPSQARRPAYVQFLSEHSLLFDLAYKNLLIRARQDRTTGTLEGIPRDLPARFIGEVAKIHQELTKHEIPLVLSSFLPKYRRGQERAVQIANADVAFYYIPWITIDGLLDAMDYYNEALLHYARTQGLPFVADRDSIPADAEHYADCMHLADKGCASMADRFCRFFEQSRVLDPIVSRRKPAREAPPQP